MWFEWSRGGDEARESVSVCERERGREEITERKIEIKFNQKGGSRLYTG